MESNCELSTHPYENRETMLNYVLMIASEEYEMHWKSIEQDCEGKELGEVSTKTSIMSDDDRTVNNGWCETIWFMLVVD